MTHKTPGILAAVFSLLLAAAPALAHHSFTAEFNSDKTATITGTITQVEWINPHTYWHVDVKDADGSAQHWVIQGGSPSEWHNAKVTRDMAGKPGDVVTIDLFMAKSSAYRGWGKKFVFLDGHTLVVQGLGEKR